MNKIFTLLILMLPLTACFGQWTQLGNAPYVNHHSNGFGYDGKGYIVQGFETNNGGTLQNRMWEYDPTTDDWTAIGFIPAPGRRFSIGDDMDDKYYWGFGTNRRDVWEFDPVANTYTELPECPCDPRAHPAFVAHNGKIYMGAGSDSNGNRNDWWVFDFATQEWTQKANIPGAARHHPYQFGIGDAIYVGGGHVSNWLKYDINTETWSEINDLPQGRVAGSQFSYNGRGFLLTGDEADHSELEEEQFLMYFPESDEWFDLPFSPEMHRWACSSFIIEDELYFFGGFGYVAGGNDLFVYKFDLSTTDCLAPNVSYAATIEENSAILIWSNSPTGAADSLQWRAEGATTWNTVANPQSGFLLDGLESCTDYEFRVNSSCTSGTAFTEPFSFRTKGCGNCLDLVYCDVTDEYLSLTNYIDRVKVNDYENQSGDDGGYQEFNSSINVEIALGDTFNLEIEPGFDASAMNYRCRVWLDLDADGEFSFEERVVAVSNWSGTLTRTIDVPTEGVLGSSRMRIALDVNNTVSACSGSGDGEVEDYCFTLVDEVTSIDDGLDGQNPISISPNPSTGNLFIQNSNSDSFTLSVYETTGKLLFSEVNPVSVNLENLPDGLYFVHIENKTTEKKNIEKLILRK